MSILFSDMYLGDGAKQQEYESGSSTGMVCNILGFLDASPMTLFRSGGGGIPASSSHFYQDNFEAFVSCMIASDETVRRLATSVATRLLVNDSIMEGIRASQRLEGQRFKGQFWRLS